MTSALDIPLPPPAEMFHAMEARDAGYDGIFVTAVRTTGIFCRPSCPAKKPARDNVEFYATPREALFAGYRPCKRCRPMEPAGSAPGWVRELIAEIDARPDTRLTGADLRRRGLDPGTVRRWFKRHHGMTFHAYSRARRLGRALGHLADGEDILTTAYRGGFESLSGFSHALRELTGSSPGSSRDAEVVTLKRFVTPLGPMLAGATDAALCLLEFVDRRMLETQLERLARRLERPLVPGENDVLSTARTELEEYFAGNRRKFTVPLAPAGTPFQRRVWDELRTIPYGATRSYGEQAERIGRLDAVRAVARANGDNPIAILVPCHRVIGADGSLTGYGGGLWRKRRLLELERGQRDLFAG